MDREVRRVPEVTRWFAGSIRVKDVTASSCGDRSQIQSKDSIMHTFAVYSRGSDNQSLYIDPAISISVSHFDIRLTRHTSTDRLNVGMYV